MILDKVFNKVNYGQELVINRKNLYAKYQEYL